MIYIGLCTDERYSMPCGICLTSIFENNKTVKVHVYILTNGLSLRTKVKYNECAEFYNQQVDIIEIKDDAFDLYPVTEHFQKSIYYRFLFPDILKNCDKLLYLDVDTIITKNIESLFNIDISKHLCGVIIDSACDDVRQKNRVAIQGDYFNSGVLLMNLSKWRDQDIARKCMQYLREYPDRCVYPDQDALNIVMDKKIKYLPIEYNLQEGFLLNKNDLLINKNRWNLIEPAVRNVAIIHYSGLLKPWHRECSHPLKMLFYEYKKKSAWSSSPVSFKFNRGIINKVKNMMILMGIKKDFPYIRKYDKYLMTVEGE